MKFCGHLLVEISHEDVSDAAVLVAVKIICHEAGLRCCGSAFDDKVALSGRVPLLTAHSGVVSR